MLLTVSKIAAWNVAKCSAAIGGGLRERRVAFTASTFQSRTGLSAADTMPANMPATNRDAVKRLRFIRERGKGWWSGVRLARTGRTVATPPALGNPPGAKCRHTVA